MPLVKSSSERAFKENIRRERQAGKPIKQALAIAYDVQRRSGHADGGGAGDGTSPSEGRFVSHFAGGGAPIPGSGIQPNLPGGGGSFQTHMHGLIHGPGTGRSDSIHMRVPKGSYMIPADIVSGIGHGNSLAGAAALDRSFPRDTRTPEGRAHVRGFEPLMNHPFGMAFPTKKMAKGGMAQAANDDGMTEIMGSAGEYLVHPDAITRRYGNLKFGQHCLDAWVMNRRKTTIKEMRKLKPPKGAKKI